MDLKFKQAKQIIIYLFLSGNLIVFIGFLKGRDIAISVYGSANAYEITEGMVLGCTYVPVIIGICLIILSLIFSTVLFNNWYKKFN